MVSQDWKGRGSCITIVYSVHRSHQQPTLFSVRKTQGEKSFQKKQEEEKATTEASKAARKLRLLLKLRGHRTVPKRGEDPAHDLKEKSLGRLATK